MITDFEMGKRNFFVEGVSGAGKTSVCDELARRGYHALHGDRILRPDKTKISLCPTKESEALDEIEFAVWVHRNAIWDKIKVLRHIENHDADVSFFCGGFRNHADLMGLFDGSFVLEVHADTLARRLSSRPIDEFGGRSVEKALIMKLHATREDMPNGSLSIDANQTIEKAADQIIELSNRSFGG